MLSSALTHFCVANREALNIQTEKWFSATVTGRKKRAEAFIVSPSQAGI
jgi:hypothetical protein